jgi:DNA-binding ferritin-like protein
MSRNKDKPIDRYPYMDNDLKGWAGEFVRVETYATGFRYLDDKIDNIIVGSGFVTHDEYDTYTQATGETLNSLQEQIDAIDVSNYVEKDTYNTYTEATDSTLESLQEQIDAIDTSAYVEKSTYNTYTEATDDRLDALEGLTEDIPNTYATKTELNECCEEVGERLDTLETTVEGIPNTYATKSELTEYETVTDSTLESLQEQIDAIDTSAYVEKTTYEADKTETDETLESLQEQIDAIDTSAYVEKSTYNTDKSETDGRLDSLESTVEAIPNTYATKTELTEYETTTDETLESLQKQIDAIDLSDFVTDDELADVLVDFVEKETYNTDKTETDGRLDSLETTVESIPNTYATKTELNECCEEVDGRLDAVEATVEAIPNTYATKTELTEYETTTDAALEDIREEIENLDNYDPATDTVLGVVKTNSAKGITLNEDNQLEVNGRLGQTEDGGLYYPTTTTPEEVKANSLMITEATGNAAYSNRIFALAGGSGINLKVTAQPGATRFEISNTFANRFIAAACRGGLLTIDNETAKVKTVPITNVYLANDTEMTPLVPYSGPTESRNNIIIETAEAFSDTDSLTKIRVYGRMRSDSSVYIGLNVGNGDTDSAVGKNLLLGQNVLSMSGNNIVVGNSHYVGKNRNAVFGGNHIINTSGTLAAGYGHDTTNGSDYVVPLGQYSLVDGDTLLAIGDGTSNTARHNVFEVRKDGSIIIAERNITQELTEATNNISTLGTQITEVEGDVSSLDTRVTALEQGGVSLSDYMGYHYYIVNSNSSYYLFNFDLAPIRSDGMSIVLNNSCVNVMFILFPGRNLLPNTTYRLGNFNEWTGISSLQKVTVPIITTSGKLIYLTIDYGEVRLTVGNDEIQSGDEITGTISFANEYPLKTVDENLEQYREY